MAKKIVMSFEGDSVNVVYGTQKRENLVVQNTRTFPTEELDNFLQKEKAKEFTVVCDFETFFSDTVLVPPVQKKYFMNILQAEIKKTFTELSKEHSLIHTIIEEGSLKGKKKQEVFVFAVNHDVIYSILNKFTKHGKRVTHLIPSILSLVQTAIDPKEPVLCVTKSGINKYLCLLKDGKLLFIRSAQGIDSGIHDFDVETINMTINHCRQSLKVDPSLVILVGSACFEYDATAGPVAPLVCLDYRPKVLASKEIIIKFMSAIACLGAEKPLKDFFKKNDVLPARYKLIHTVQDVLKYATFLFLILFIAGSGYTTLNLREMLETKNKADTHRASMKNLETIKSGYKEKMEARQKFIPLINLINRMSSEPDFHQLLIVMANISLENIKVQNISVTPGGGVLNLSMKGVVEAEGLNQTRTNYQNFIDSVKKNNGMNISTHGVEVQDKTFSVVATYKPE